MGVMRCFVPPLATTLAITFEPSNITFVIIGSYPYQHTFSC